MERSALGQTLRPLKRDGFIDFGQDERDGRRWPIKLTKVGKIKWSADGAIGPVHEKFKHFFGDNQSAVLRETLRDIAEARNFPKLFSRSK